MTNAHWIVGPESDASLVAKLGSALLACHYSVDSATWGVGGSQELSTWTVSGPNGVLVVEAETYIGLSVTGDPGLVAELRVAFTSMADRLASHDNP